MRPLPPVSNTEITFVGLIASVNSLGENLFKEEYRPKTGKGTTIYHAHPDWKSSPEPTEMVGESVDDTRLRKGVGRLEDTVKKLRAELGPIEPKAL